jgi:uncharacterized protein (TIGR02145 family)
MKTKFFKIPLTAILAFAITFTFFACSSGNSIDGNNSGNGDDSTVNLYCDYGPVTEYGGGCFEMSNAYDCDTEWGQIVYACGDYDTQPSSSSTLLSSSSRAQSSSSVASSSSVQVVEYCDWGEPTEHEDGGCWPISNAENRETCILYGEIYINVPVSERGFGKHCAGGTLVPKPSSSSNATLSSSSELPSSSSSAHSSSSSIPSSSSSATLCGTVSYDPATQFCYNNSKVGNKCGINPQSSYNPDLYECKTAINPNGIFLKEPVSYGGASYEAVLIGTQVWMARNLNYNVSGSKCGDWSSETFVDRNTTTCDSYGRLYNWNTAMNNATSSSANPSGRQGICPSGWHLPSDAEWTALMNFVGASAGTKLKARGGWISGNGTDDYGFSALPGGTGLPSGICPPSIPVGFYNASFHGYWWSATQSNASNAWSREMGYNNGNVLRASDVKGRLWSVRCVKD